MGCSPSKKLSVFDVNSIISKRYRPSSLAIASFSQLPIEFGRKMKPLGAIPEELSILELSTCT